MKRKIFSIVLSLCMVLTMMPMATSVAWATGTKADSVTIGGVTLNSSTPYYHNGIYSSTGLEDGSQGTADNNATGANAIFDATTGTLTLNGLVLNNESDHSIRSSGDLTIVLQNGPNNDIGHQNNESNIIKVEGALTITGPGRLTANNGSSFFTTIYASGDITINGGAVVNATHAGGNAQAINADNGLINITGTGTTVTAKHSEVNPTATNAFALKAENGISVSYGAELTATSGKQAVSGSVSVDTANSDVYAGDSAPGTKLEPINSTDTYTAKYLKIAPKAPVAPALENITFGFAYDAQRKPTFPTGSNTNIGLYELINPLDNDGSTRTDIAGSWTLSKAGTYSYVGSTTLSYLDSEKLNGIVSNVATEYSLTADQKKAIVIHELKKGDSHIAYGVVIAYNSAEGKAVFIGDKWSNDGACYLLSNSEITDYDSYTIDNPFNITAGEIATDFVKNISIELDTSGTYIFPSATTGYTPFTKNVSVSNTGNDNTGALTIALSGTNADSFSLSTTSISDIAVGGNATFAVSPASGLDAGTYSATVTVSGKEVVSQSFGISFSIDSISVQEIKITNPPVKTSYAEGEDFSIDGMVVTATYTDSSTADVTSESVVLDGSNLIKGKDTVTIQYTENGVAKTAIQRITVGDAILSDIEVTTLPSKTTYKAGDSFDKTGMVVSAIYTNGSKIEVTNYTVINGDSLTSGQDSVTIQYTENGIVKTAILPITVSEASQPVRPSRPNRDNVTVSGSASSSDAKTDADLSKTTVTADGVTTSTVDTVTAGKIVDKSVANKSTSIDIKATSGSAATKTSKVIIPTATIKSISEKTDASMNIKCDIANIEFSKEAIDSMASQATGDTVQIIVEKVSESQHEVNFELKVVCSDGTVISDYNGGSVSVTVSLPSSMADKDLVCVYIDDEGIYNKVDGMLNADGSYTFITNHFSTYAIMAEEEADAVIAKQTAAAQKAAIKKVKATVALSTKNVKKGIRVTVKVPVDQKADKTGIILYRSKKKDSAYAMYKKIETKSSTYIITNTRNVKGNRLTVGKRYYYKARAYKVIDGKTYYGPMSTVKYMKAK